MNPDVVYCKTPKGIEEMTKRTFKLPARIRALLIMIDGKALVADLISRSPAPEEMATNFAILLEGGFIEPKGVGPSQAASTNVPPVGVDPIEQARKFMIASMVNALGPDADYFTGKLEAAREMTALTELAPKYIEVVRTGGGTKKAEAFKAGLIEHGVIDGTPGQPVTSAAGGAAPTPEQADEARRLANTKKAVCRYLHEVLGPDADNFTMKVEACPGTAELRQLAARLLEVIRGAAGARKAEDFRQRILEALSS